jgi:hypothetical protein
MARFHSIEVQVDGRRYHGAYQLAGKGKIEVVSDYGDVTIALGRMDPDGEARLALQELVVEWLKGQR